MRLVSFGTPGAERPGVLRDDRIVDLLALDPMLPSSWREILAADGLADVERLCASEVPVRTLVPVAGTRLGPPIPNASKIVCIGLNYADHCREQNKPLPEAPLLFAKAPSALCGHGDAIVLPADETVDVEAELAVVIARRASRVSAADAEAFIAGYMCFNDVSGRKAQFSDRQWFRGKSYDTFAPCGPCLVTRDEIPDAHALAISSRVDDRIMQTSSTDQMVFRIPHLVEVITRSMTLLPGDIISTGTPAGVGVFRHPPVFLAAGERVTITIEGLGTLSNPVHAG